MGNVAETFQNACAGEREHTGAVPLADAHLGEKQPPDDAAAEAAADATLVQRESTDARSVEKEKDPRKAGCFLFGCGALVFCLASAITVAVLAAVFVVRTQNPCAVEKLEDWHSWVNSSVVLGTKVNTRWFAVDLTGVWWKRWKHPHGWLPSWRYYDAEAADLGLSFGGLQSNASGLPARVTVPVNQPGGRLFSDGLQGRLALARAAGTDPKEPMVIVFENETYGRIMEEEKVAWTMEKVGEDRWRVSEAGGGSGQYELTRIVTEDGQQHPIFWGYFMDHLGPYSARTFRFNDTCRRSCGVYRSNCKACEERCR